MITYETAQHAVHPAQAEGFFVGWPAPPTPEMLVRVMDASHRRVWALECGRPVGLANAISDGLLTAFIPWLEVLPSHQGRGIGSELLRRLVAELDDMYSIDLTCDEDLVPFYTARGFTGLAGAGVRRPGALRAAVTS
ncbi:GNAT family N-acetyltransferase [Brevibacterium sp. BRM-1]|uniref:GNAT family N-acetyltransferase n=1 Tax=Brevibacterium sp. BRM-1 TaxID=2999062 RepID=UPI00227F718A|nr:GNAT family N-acetyltransferase [Brevibacterium sp. BRM-1]WAL40580.1 GNAT family N-acetyltransferase [Brevibacterium sp. BRM-1]